jgi:hypothetical protein
MAARITQGLLEAAGAYGAVGQSAEAQARLHAVQERMYAPPRGSPSSAHALRRGVLCQLRQDISVS